MEIDIRGRVFKIEFVNNYCHEKYSEMVKLAFDLSDRENEIKAAGELQDARTAIDRMKEILTAPKKLVELRNEILLELLETNGYEYDKNFWERKTSPNDINELVAEAIEKDRHAVKPSKKK